MLKCEPSARHVAAQHTRTSIASASSVDSIEAVFFINTSRVSAQEASARLSCSARERPWAAQRLGPLGELLRTSAAAPGGMPRSRTKECKQVILTRASVLRHWPASLLQSTCPCTAALCGPVRGVRRPVIRPIFPPSRRELSRRERGGSSVVRDRAAELCAARPDRPLVCRC